MRIFYDMRSNQAGGGAASYEKPVATASPEQAYHEAIADHGADSAEALVELNYLHWLDRQR